MKWGTEGCELSAETAEGISAEVEWWDSMISTSFITLRMDERFGHYNLCNVSGKVAYSGWRVETIYTKTQLVFPSSSVSTHSLDLRASTYQRTSQSEPWGNVSTAESFWEPPSHTHRTGFRKITATGVSQVLPDLASSFLPSLSSWLLFKSYTCPHSDTYLHTLKIISS